MSTWRTHSLRHSERDCGTVRAFARGPEGMAPARWAVYVGERKVASGTVEDGTMGDARAAADEALGRMLRAA